MQKGTSEQSRVAIIKEVFFIKNNSVVQQNELGPKEEAGEVLEFH